MSNNNEACGISEILQVILVLQQNASCCGESCIDSCDRPMLGCVTSNCCQINTRPVMLYSCQPDGTRPITMPISKDIIVPTTEESSSVFRVEKVEDCTATFRVLAPNPDDTSGLRPYVSTNSFFTLNLDCCCAIRCLNDTCVDCL